jgi:hypothetical protein
MDLEGSSMNMYWVIQGFSLFVMQIDRLYLILPGVEIKN